ncbi:hypothetical protein PSAB6_190142 [Paraburkholderia sabiae]|nr:hypothetical protein PSAB6_190142 [Paraburkholderia sabiae]
MSQGFALATVGFAPAIADNRGRFASPIQARLSKN